MKYSPRRKIKKIICLFPDFAKINIRRDYGPISLFLSKLGYDVKILTYLNDSNKELRAIDGVELIKIHGKPRTLYSIHFPILHYILKNRRSIDCIFASFTTSNVIASVIFKWVRNGIFIIQMDSDGRLYRGNLVIRAIKHFIGELIFRLLFSTANLLIIETPEARERVLHMHPYLKNKLIMLPFGIDQNMWGKLSKSIKPQKNKIILFAGRVEYGKGVDLLIKAFSRLKDKYPDWKLIVDGEIMSSFKDELAELISNLKDRVILTNSLCAKDLAKNYMQAEIFCFPSRHFHSLGPESFGVVLLEAMYFENAIMSSDAGAAEYVLDYGNAGLIFENENIDELATKLDRLIKDGNLRKKLARNARLRCEKVFDWKKIINELDAHIKNRSKIS